MASNPASAFPRTRREARAAAREAVAAGLDTEAMWLRLTAARWVPPGVLAGWLEGLASTRRCAPDCLCCALRAAARARAADDAARARAALFTAVARSGGGVR
ncbi:hypothetical protein [Streptomyces sp. WMMC897]|uniref:hypothetical protein n=1 Tax=Streptomyces sp. WMMC897 TaxID=3014782 RepID=UPI0022B7049F|nr:hypothetical protein [Streptomyces sp. WMMC897]MCZ7414277.1 hypothetical protein [Streptomyces sp. WMMC897]